MRVLIPGAGVAGLTYARWPHQTGHTPVVERVPRCCAAASATPTASCPHRPNDAKETEQ